MMLKKRGQGQSWSLDMILAVVVFILIIAVFYSLLSSNKGTTKTDTLQKESNTILSALDSSTGLNNSYAVINKGNIDPQKLQELYSSDYGALKQQLGLRGDFCIYVVDQNGNIITVIANGTELAGFGNGNLSINDIPCGTRVPPSGN